MENKNSEKLIFSGGAVEFDMSTNLPSSWGAATILGYTIQQVPIHVQNQSAEGRTFAFYKADESIFCRTNCINKAIRLSSSKSAVGPNATAEFILRPDAELLKPGVNLYLFYSANPNDLQDTISDKATLDSIKKIRIKLTELFSNYVRINSQTKSLTSGNPIKVAGAKRGVARVQVRAVKVVRNKAVMKLKCVLA